MTQFGSRQMLSTAQAAERLGITSVRVRDLLNEGKLKGERIGRSWVVYGDSVDERLCSAPRAGRPLKKDDPVSGIVSVESGSPDGEAEGLHELYRRCEDLLAGGYDAKLFRMAKSEKESRFYASVADFFLQEKQRELIEAGVY